MRREREFPKGHFFFKLCFFSFLIVMSFIFIGPLPGDAESGDGIMKNLASSLHLEVTKEPGQSKDVGSIEPGKIFSEVIASTPHVRLLLSQNWRLFFNVRPTMRDYYDTRDNKNKKCASFGFDFLF